MEFETSLLQRLYTEIDLLQRRFDAMSELMHREDDRISAFYDHYTTTLASLAFITESLQLFSQKVSYQQVMLLNLLQIVAEKAGVDLDLDKVLPTMAEFEGVMAVAREEKEAAEHYVAKSKSRAAEIETARAERELRFVQRYGASKSEAKTAPAADAAPSEEAVPEKSLDPVLRWAFENAREEG